MNMQTILLPFYHQKLNPFEGFAHSENLLSSRIAFKRNEYMSSKFNYFASNNNEAFPQINVLSTHLNIVQDYLSVIKTEE